jgi:hypothetical protein
MRVCASGLEQVDGIGPGRRRLEHGVAAVWYLASRRPAARDALGLRRMRHRPASGLASAALTADPTQTSPSNRRITRESAAWVDQISTGESGPAFDRR